MNRTSTIWNLAHAVARRTVAEFGGDYRVTFGAALREVYACEDEAVYDLLDEAEHASPCAPPRDDNPEGGRFARVWGDLDYEFVACAVWAVEGTLRDAPMLLVGGESFACAEAA
jgi:hypothetical protein